MKATPFEQWLGQRIGAGSGRPARSDLETYQLEKLRETIHWARTRSAFYRGRLAGLTEDDLSDLEDLGRFPFTTEEDLRQSPLRFLCVSQGSVYRVVTVPSPGTGGRPKRVYFIQADLEQTVDFFRQGLSLLAGPGDKVLVLFPADRPGGVGDLVLAALKGLGALGLAPGPVSDPARTIELIFREEVKVVVGLPTHVLALARFSRGLSGPGGVMLSGDHVPDSLVREIQDAWGASVLSHYGMTEMGFGGGVECAARRGYHLREADLYFEIIDPGTGRPVPEGQPGEVVFTTLTRRGMPLLRYRTGDLSRFLPLPCPCGAALRTLARVKARSGDRVEIGPDKSLTMADLDEALFGVKELLDFRPTLQSRGEKLCLRLEVKVKAGPENGILSAVEDALAGVAAVQSVREEGALEVEIQLRTWTGDTPLDYAKRAIMDSRKQGRPPEGTH
ncbi:MAG: DVU_1553 family AMP-dependent CoA ligase [Thermodesulfobacteriota bacterium]